MGLFTKLKPKQMRLNRRKTNSMTEELQDFRAGQFDMETGARIEPAAEDGGKKTEYPGEVQQPTTPAPEVQDPKFQGERFRAGQAMEMPTPDELRATKPLVSEK